MKLRKNKKKSVTFTLQTKRRPVDRFGLRRLHARVTRRQRVTAAEAADEGYASVPNVGVARALMIILGLHVLAIAGIFVHNRYFDRGDAEAAAKTEVKPLGPAPAPAPVAPEPKLAAGDFAYVVVSGDNYAKVAVEHGVPEEELRVANLNVPLRPGRLLRIPPRRVVALESPELARRRQAGAGQTPAPDESAAVLVRPARRLEEKIYPKATVVREPAPGAARQAARESRPPARESRPAAAGTTYQVKPGESVWRIANRFKVSEQDLMKANGLADARKLRAGMTLRIPE